MSNMNRSEKLVLQGTPQYQRAVTPTVTNDHHNSNNGQMGTNIRPKGFSTNNIYNNSNSAPNSARRSSSNSRHGSVSTSVDTGVGGASVRGSKISSYRNNIPSNPNASGSTNNAIPGAYDAGNGLGLKITGSHRNNNGIAHVNEGYGSLSSALVSILPRQDLIPLTDDIPSDKIVFARVRNYPEMLVCFRTPEERAANPERLNLDRRQLDVCPHLELETRLRLLNFQNNNIRHIRNVDHLNHLIFLDMYNNKLTSLDGPLSNIMGLRVLMAGKNRISNISNLTQLKKLDVLDLHSNCISEITGLHTLTELRVLNLAGNKISTIQNMSKLVSLTELNLRRNLIQEVRELNQLPALQRVFLSHNVIQAYEDIQCLFHMPSLIELSLDGNPISQNQQSAQEDSKDRESKGVLNRMYRTYIIEHVPSLKHLDLKPITIEERGSCVLPVDQNSLSENNKRVNNSVRDDSPMSMLLPPQPSALATPSAPTAVTDNSNENLSANSKNPALPPTLPEPANVQMLPAHSNGNPTGLVSRDRTTYDRVELNSDVKRQGSNSSQETDNDGVSVSSSVNPPNFSGNQHMDARPDSVVDNESCEAAEDEKDIGAHPKSVMKQRVTPILKQKSLQSMSVSNSPINNSNINTRSNSLTTDDTLFQTPFLGKALPDKEGLKSPIIHSLANTDASIDAGEGAGNGCLVHSVNRELEGVVVSADQIFEIEVIPAFGIAGCHANASATDRVLYMQCSALSFNDSISNASARDLDVWDISTTLTPSTPAKPLTSPIDWFALSQKGKLLNSVTKAYFNRVSLATLITRINIHTGAIYDGHGVSSTGTGNSSSNQNPTATTLFYYLTNCRYMKFTQNCIGSLQDLYLLSQYVNNNSTTNIVHANTRSINSNPVGLAAGKATPLEHLTVLQNGICDVSPVLLRYFIIALFCPSTLISVNDMLISKEDRLNASHIFNNIQYKVIPTAIATRNRQAALQHSNEFIQFMQPNNKNSGTSSAGNTSNNNTQMKKNSLRSSIIKTNTNKDNGSVNSTNTACNSGVTANGVVTSACSRAIESKAIKLEFESQFDDVMIDLIKSCLVDLREYDPL